MARSRVGGSKGLLSGKVGDVIYSITRNADGSFRQMIGANPESRFNPNTDAQACARMTMGMIERAMFTYRDFMGTGFEGVDPGTNSVSKFSEVNYNEIREEILQYWDMPDWTEWNYDFPKKGQTVPKDGMFIISQGSIRWDGLVYCVPATSNRRYFEVECLSQGVQPTVRHWLTSHNLKPGMQFVGIFFCEGTTPSRSFVAWIMLWTGENVRLDDVLTASNWRNYIKTNSNVPINAYFSDTDGSLHLRCERLDDLQVSRTGCTGRRIRMRDGDKFRYNNCQMQWNVFPTPQEAWGWKTLWDVKPSWLNEQPSSRLPNIYQEVEWVQWISGGNTVISESIPVRSLRMISRVSGVMNDHGVCFYTLGGMYGFYLRFWITNAKYEYYIGARGSNGKTVIKRQQVDSPDFDCSFVLESVENGYKLKAFNKELSVSVTYDNDDDPVKALQLWGEYNKLSNYRIYETIIENIKTDSLMYDLVPCFRKSDGFCGFYDIVSQQFFTGQTESGQYVHGGIIS